MRQIAKSSLRIKDFTLSVHKNFTQKEYKNYGEYVKHQISKTDGAIATGKRARPIRGWDIMYRKMMSRTIKKYPFLERGMSVLCLGARRGGEVRAFVDCGCFAVGIDLLPTPRNGYVLYGDFNEIRYKDETVDVVFTNSLDHAYDIEATAREIHRVLKKTGRFIFDYYDLRLTNLGDKWACCWWKKPQDIIDLFSLAGFVLENRINVKHFIFTVQLWFKKKDV